MAGADHKARRGRPREFCTQEALATAIRLFWAKGFEGTSVSDLAGAMGISKPSLYAAFGDKEALFAKAFRLYTLEELAFVDEALEKPSARMVAEHLLHSALALHCSQSSACGRMGMAGFALFSAETGHAKTVALTYFASVRDRLRSRFACARAEGDVPAGVDAGGLADVLLCVLQGMAVQAGTGASERDLQRMIDLMLAFWPCGTNAHRASDLAEASHASQH